MTLVKKGALLLESIPNSSFNLNPSCSVCTEEYDTGAHIPKVLICGHTLCLECITKMIGSVQVSYIGDGEVNTNFVCHICRTSMVVPQNGAKGFPTNFELQATTNDARYLRCTTCEIHGSERSFHICRECTIEVHEYDVQCILEEEPPLHPDRYIICSTCVLREHNTPEHTVIEYLPIRLNYQFHKNILSVNVNSAQAIEKFAILRTIFSTIPLLIEKEEGEVSRMVEMVQKAKSSQSQRLIFRKYGEEMKKINKLLDELITQGGKLNSELGDKVNALQKLNTETSLVHCLQEIPNLSDVLKLSRKAEIKQEVEVDRVVVNDPEPVLVQVSQPSESPEPSSVRESEKNFESRLEPILKKTWEFVCAGLSWLYNLRSTQVMDMNNHNQEVGVLRSNMMLVSFLLILLAFIILKIIF